MRAVLLIGSPRGERSTSRGLGVYTLEGLRSRGWEVEERYTCRDVTTSEGLTDLLAAVERSDLLILSFPTYVDSPPAAVVRVMETMHGRIKRGGALLAIANCGFISSMNNASSLSICRLFARDIGWEWRGGLSLGGGNVLAGRTLEEAGGVARSVRRALDQAVSALAEGKAVPQGTIDLMGRNIVPPFIYNITANRAWDRAARKNKVLERIRDRPYMEERR
ncbi:MAG: NADPH-dependent FMN reductase [Methanomassiliicoccales archaeon PtaB.Bin134]|nr:MAG: NADPH-dependent FMN reductase [Methanomassiliicoccales archaeon PtaB.Bin134]